MSADGPNRPPPPSSGVVGHVSVGAYELVLGDPDGTTVELLEGGVESSELAQAIEQEQADRAPAGDASPKGALDITGKAERAVSLFAQIATHRLDPEKVSDEVEELVGLLGHLSEKERWQELLGFVRSLARLLALLKRWRDLVRSLLAALRAAESIGDESGRAWALHELGTVHLAGGKLVEADTMLCHARELRARIGERRGRALTEHNLQTLCRTLRARLHEQRPDRGTDEKRYSRRVAIGALALVAFIVGGAAGAATSGSSHHDGQTVTVPRPSPAVRIAFSPASPSAEAPVSFHATVEGAAGPIRYLWSFGDHRHAGGADPIHAYRHHGVYTAGVTAENASGGAIASGSVRVHVRPEPEKHEPGPSTSTLTVTRTGEGDGTVTTATEGIDCGNVCSHAYTTGTAVILTAVPVEGSTFTGWEGACAGTEACRLTMSEDKTVGAAFDPPRVTLTVATTGIGKGTVTSADGQIACSSECTSSYKQGTTITLTATPALGSKFRGWSGACSGVEPCQLTLRSTAAVTAQFDVLIG